MGKLNDGLFGAFTGRIGNLVGYSLGGVDLVRKRPRRRSKHSATEKQLEQRERFALAIKFLTPITEVVGAYFGKRHKTKSRFNFAVSYNLEHSIVPSVGGGFEINYQKVMISKGDLRGVDSGMITSLPNQELKLDWTDNSGQGSAKDTDVMLVVLYSPGQDLFHIFNPAALRGQTTVTLTVPGFFRGDEVHIWVAMVTEDRKEASVSSYLGTADIL